MAERPRWPLPGEAPAGAAPRDSDCLCRARLRLTPFTNGCGYRFCQRFVTSWYSHKNKYLQKFQGREDAEDEPSGLGKCWGTRESEPWLKGLAAPTPLPGRGRGLCPGDAPGSGIGSAPSHGLTSARPPRGTHRPGRSSLRSKRYGTLRAWGKQSRQRLTPSEPGQASRPAGAAGSSWAKSRAEVSLLFQCVGSTIGSNSYRGNRSWLRPAGATEREPAPQPQPPRSSRLHPPARSGRKRRTKPVPKRQSIYLPTESPAGSSNPARGVYASRRGSGGQDPRRGGGSGAGVGCEEERGSRQPGPAAPRGSGTRRRLAQCSAAAPGPRSPWV